MPLYDSLIIKVTPIVGIRDQLTNIEVQILIILDLLNFESPLEVECKIIPSGALLNSFFHQHCCESIYILDDELNELKISILKDLQSKPLSILIIDVCHSFQQDVSLYAMLLVKHSANLLELLVNWN